MKRLSEMSKGQRAYVHALRGSSELNERLLRMGILEGALIELLHEAPFRDPIAIQVRGALIALRREEASFIEVTES